MLNYAEKYNKNNLERKISYLPETFRCIINGKSGSGKTNLLLNILSKIFENYNYINVTICSRTIEQFLYQEFIKESKENFKNVVIEETKELLYFNENYFEIMEKYDSKKIIILDDIYENYEILNHLFSSTRPRNISVFYLSQRYTQLDIRCRQQINYLITFKQSEKDLKFIYKENLANILEFNELCDLFKTNQNFFALFCDLEKNIIKTTNDIFCDENYIFYDDLNDLIEQLKILVGEKNAGNDSVDNKIKFILNELEKHNVISNYNSHSSSDHYMKCNSYRKNL